MVRRCTKSWSRKAPWCSHLSFHRIATPISGDLTRSSGSRRGGSRDFRAPSQTQRYLGYIRICESFRSPAGNSLTHMTLPRVTFIGGGRACIGFKFSQLEMSKLVVHLPASHALLTLVHTKCRHQEVVLCMLLDKFKFAPVKGKEVEWKMTGIVTPGVVGESGPPQLPLVVSLAG